MELSQGPGLLRLHVLQVEAPNQEVIAPDVLRHQVHLENIIDKDQLQSPLVTPNIHPDPVNVHTSPPSSTPHPECPPPLTPHLQHPHLTLPDSPRRCGRGTSLHQASSDHTVSLRPPPELSSSRSPCSRSPKPSAAPRTNGLISGEDI